MTAKVLAVSETKGGALAGVSMEVATVARELADALEGSVDAAVCGVDAAGVAGALGEHGADRVVEVAVDDGGAGGGDGTVAERAAALAGLAARGGYRAVVLAATGPGRDLAPRVAAKLAVPLLTDVVAVQVDGNEVVATRPVYAGKALARVRATVSPTVLSIRPNAFAARSAPRQPELARHRGGGGGGRGYRVAGFEEAAGASLDVAEAAIVVSGGRGLKGPENWPLLEDLRDALGDSAALGASRAVVDAGWRPHAEQVGQTGKTVTPKLYFAIAISGAIQHLAGMRTSGLVVAVNRDPDAPIFGVADYGIVGDAFEVVPALAREVRRLRESS